MGRKAMVASVSAGSSVRCSGLVPTLAQRHRTKNVTPCFGARPNRLSAPASIPRGADPHSSFGSPGRAVRQAGAVPSSSALPLPPSGRELTPERGGQTVVVLGIESSCDDTGVAVVTSDGRVLGEAIATQAEIHSQWGGVVPNLARDAHAAAIDRTVDSALAAAGIGPQQLSAVAVTIGPGLGLCLRVGAAKARDLSRQYGIPLVSVHHMEAHALVARLPAEAAAAAPPAVRLSAAPAARPAAGDIGSRSGEQGSSSEGASATPPSKQQLQLEVRHEQQQQEQQQQPEIMAVTPTLPHSPQLTASGPSALQQQWQSAGDGGGDDGGSTAAIAPLDVGAVMADVGGAAAVPFPFLCLLISGGHNLLVLVRGVGRYVQLGTTVDDALGEAYDKVARLLNLELRPHGGAALEALAREGDPKAFKFAVPMRRHATCDFSFAGLKTNTRLAIEQTLRPELVEGMSPGQLRKAKADIAASFQSVAVTHLIEKTRRGVAWARELVPELRHLVVAGGVACNQLVRGSLNKLAEAEGLELVLPPPRWCTDNGVMVAWAGIERLANGWAEPPPPPLPHPSAADAAASTNTASSNNPTATSTTSGSMSATATPQQHAHAHLPPSPAPAHPRAGPPLTCTQPPTRFPAYSGVRESPEGPDRTSTLEPTARDAAAASISPTSTSVSDASGASQRSGSERGATSGSGTAAEGGGVQAATPSASGSGQAGGPQGSLESEWIELKPRWPLTSEVHPRIAAARQEERRSLKRVRMSVPLSDLTPPMLPTASTAAPSTAATAAGGGSAATSAEAAVAVPA